MSEKTNTLVVLAIEVKAEEDTDESRQAAADQLVASLKEHGVEADIQEIDELEEDDGDDDDEEEGEEKGPESE